jgi:hypothetical protein
MSFTRERDPLRKDRHMINHWIDASEKALAASRMRFLVAEHLAATGDTKASLRALAASLRATEDAHTWDILSHAVAR